MPVLHLTSGIQSDSANPPRLPCVLDNPSYFHDPYVSQTGRDASAYVLAGLALAAQFPNGRDPGMVWLVRRSENVEGEGQWTKTLVFQDDGAVLRSCSTAVLVAIHPGVNQGRKQAWLLVTGPVARGVVRMRVDL